MRKILFVCTGNICRSPTAEGVLRHQLETEGLGQFEVDSAGTHGYHVGEAPDSRAVAVAKQRGVLIDGLRARKVGPSDFNDFDLILGLDFEHLHALRKIAPENSTAHVDLFLEYAGGTREKEVPDPYYGHKGDFEYALDLIEAGSKALVEKLKNQKVT